VEGRANRTGRRITRTPLFIDYSLTDPDFQSIRAVVRARLGAFERMSYVVQFDATDADVETLPVDRWRPSS
jgi:hypothetical protein